MSAHRWTSAGMVLLVLAAGGHEACGQQWRSVGPPGGTPYSVAIDPVTPTTAYAAVGGLALKTTDGGASWTESSLGLPAAGTATDLTINPAAPSRVWMINQAMGAVFRRFDLIATRGG